MTDQQSRRTSRMAPYFGDDPFGTDPLGYEPISGEWICETHGMPECRQGACADLPWEATKTHDLHDFIKWAHGQFESIMQDVAPDDDTPDDAFNAYWPADWVKDTSAGQQPTGDES